MDAVYLLPDNQQQSLRRIGVISFDEVAIKIGDLLLAEDVITRERRKITQENTNEGKRILRG
jgi:hypothetical protein